MIKVRISKYDSKYRVNGVFTKEEWTDYSDVGGVFNGHVFTLKEYLKIEQKYLSVINDIINLCKIPNFIIDSLEKYDETTKWENNKVISKEEINKIIIDCLRNKCWCRLTLNEYYIHFGYDFYVYLSVPLKIDDIKRICEMYNLYVETMDSPFE